MSKTDQIPLTEVLLGRPVVWEKPHHRDVMEHVREHHAEIVYEDDHVVAYFDDEDEREGPASPGEKRISISPKSSPPSLMDVDVTDGKMITHLLHAVQQVTFKLGLQKSGFEVRANVLPPYQQHPFIKLKLRTGDAQKAQG